MPSEKPNLRSLSRTTQLRLHHKRSNVAWKLSILLIVYIVFTGLFDEYILVSVLSGYLFGVIALFGLVKNVKSMYRSYYRPFSIFGKSIKVEPYYFDRPMAWVAPLAFMFYFLGSATSQLFNIFSL